VANSLWLSLGAGGGGALLVAALLAQLRLVLPHHGIYLWLAAAFVPPAMFFMIAPGLLIGSRRVFLFNVYQIGNAVLNLACNGVAALAAPNVSGFLLASVAASWITLAALLLSFARLAPGPLGFDAPAFQTGLRYSGRAYLVTMLGFLVLRSNVFLLNHFCPASEVGYFSIAAQISDVLAILPTSVALVLFPALVRSEGSPWPATLRSLAAVGGLLAAACLAAAVLVGPFVRIAFGPEFRPAVPILFWMLPGGLFLGLTCIVSQYLAAQEFPRAILGVWTAAFVLVTLSSLVLIPAYGAAGAAAALSLTHGALFVMLFILGWVTHRRVTVPQSEIPAIVSAEA